MTPDTDHVSQRSRIERQRRLPFAKAVEISLKAIRVRFWRSMLTVSSIILAIAFLMWQLTSAEIVRRLEEVADQKVTVPEDPTPIWLADWRAEGLKRDADLLKDTADRIKERLQPVLDACDTVEARLEAGKALAAVDTWKESLAKAEAALTAAAQALNDEDLQSIRRNYEDYEDTRDRLERRLLSSGPGDPQYKQLDADLKAVKRYLEEKRSDYNVYLRKQSDKERREAERDEAKKRLAKAADDAEKGRKQFHRLKEELKPAPEGSDEYRRLYADFRVAKRKKDRAESSIESAKNRSESAKDLYERRSRNGLDQMLAEHTGKRRGERGNEAEREEISLPFNLELTPTRLWIISLALLVCLVGITNAMLMSVTERYREIGTMKCLGALDSFIVKIFLLESSFMGLIGVLLGIVLGFVLAFLVQCNTFGWYFVTTYFPGVGILKWTAVGFVVGAVLSVLGGILPARRAAKMTPVDAMRIEE